MGFFLAIKKHKGGVIKNSLLTPILILFLNIGLCNKVAAQSPNLAWAKQFSSTGNGFAWSFSVATDANGNIYTTGVFVGTVDFDPGPGIFNLSGRGSFISKLDAAGNFVWAKQLTGVTSTSFCNSLGITLDATGDVFIRGSFKGTVDFDPGPSNYNITSTGTDSLVFVCKINNAGNFIWAKSIDANNNGFYVGTSVATDKTGNVYITGTFGRTGDFDPGPGVYNMTPVDKNDAFILKLDGSGNFVWAKQIAGSQGQWGTTVAVDTNADVYVLGSFQGTADFDPGPGVFLMTSTIGGLGAQNFVLKMNSSGNFIWAKSFGACFSITSNLSCNVDALSNIYITASFEGTADFDPGPGTYFMTAGGTAIPNIFISKLDANGNFVWAKQFGQVTAIQFVKSIATDLGGNIYTIGSFDNTVDFDPGPGIFNLNGGGTFISKLDPSGNFVWAIQFTNSGGNGITTDAMGNVYATGIFSDTADFNPCTEIYNLKCSGLFDSYVVKLSPPIFINTTFLSITANANDICPGVTVNFTALPVNATAIPFFQWKLNGTDVGTNSLTYSNNNLKDGDKINCLMTFSSCSGSPIIYSDTVTMIVKPVPDITLDPLNPTISHGSSVQLNATLSGNVASYLWSPSNGLNSVTILNPVASPIINTVYNLNVTASNNCTVQKSLTVNVLQKVYIPNSFTPNGDGKNDIFRIPPGATFTLQKFIVYDRFGNTIFETNDINKGWNGTFKGTLSPMGTYIYLIKGYDVKGEVFLKGSFLLIH